MTVSLHRNGRPGNRAAFFHTRRLAPRRWQIAGTIAAEETPNSDAADPNMPDILKTPSERFANLPGFAWSAHSRGDLPGYSGLSMSYLDEGPTTAPVFLCLHGQPTWSYLYRRMIPHFLATGARVVAPDFFGFGRSDKPADEAVYTFDFHRGSLLALVRALDLKDVTLVVQDWGGLLGLTLPMEMPERFSRLIVMNTALPTGEVPLPRGFLDWRAFSNSQPDMAVGKLMARACPHLSPAEAAAYDAPFPDATFKAGVRRFPNLVPEFPDSDGAALERAARDFWRSTWRAPSVMAIGMTDPVLGPAVMRALHRDIRGCPPPHEFAEAGHFVQEWGDAVAPAALAALGA
jgi:haloalkane dehalogenase